MTTSFTHRTLTGWISEFVNRPLPGVWPQIPLDDATIEDFEDYFHSLPPVDSWLSVNVGIGQ